MSYSIYIGEPKIVYYPEDDYMKIAVECIEHPDAPEFFDGDISGKTNGRHPGYGQMHDFCERTGLLEVFYDEEYGLLRPHPGCRPLLPKHLEEIKKAKIRWEQSHPYCQEWVPYKDKEPENYKNLSWDEQAEFDMHYDWFYARLIWYEFWMDWALKNCRMPSVENY